MERGGAPGPHQARVGQGQCVTPSTPTDPSTDDRPKKARTTRDTHTHKHTRRARADTRSSTAVRSFVQSKLSPQPLALRYDYVPTAHDRGVARRSPPIMPRRPLLLPRAGPRQPPAWKPASAAPVAPCRPGSRPGARHRLRF